MMSGKALPFRGLLKSPWRLRPYKTEYELYSWGELYNVRCPALLIPCRSVYSVVPTRQEPRSTQKQKPARVRLCVLLRVISCEFVAPVCDRKLNHELTRRHTKGGAGKWDFGFASLQRV